MIRSKVSVSRVRGEIGEKFDGVLLFFNLVNRALESSCGGSGRIGSWGTDQFGDFCPTVLSSSDEVIEEVASFIEGRLNEDEAKEENDLGRRVSVKSAFGLQPSFSMVLTADPTEDVTETPLW